MIDGMLAGTTKSQTEIDLDPITDADHYFGSKDAEIVIVEYSDLECPFCARFHATMHQLITDYNGKVAWVYRHLPLEQIHQTAMSRAISAECVYDIGGDTKFWSYIDALFKGAEPKKPVFDPITGETK
jgi:protein-disulfide isomerase